MIPVNSAIAAHQVSTVAGWVGQDNRDSYQVQSQGSLQMQLTEKPVTLEYFWYFDINNVSMRCAPAAAYFSLIECSKAENMRWTNFSE